MNRAIVQYHYIGDEHAILVGPHGNSKKSQSYVRTMPSTLQKLTDVSKKLTPKPTVHAVSSHAGGVLGASSAGSLPRNDRQVKDIRRNMKAQSNDPLLSVMMMCKESMKHFVRTVTGAPDYMVFLSLDRTLDNIVRFCTTPMLPTVLTFDPTFSLGQFEVTVTTYKHPLLVFRNPQEHSSCHPSLLGPILVHQRKQFTNYHYLTSTMVGLRPELHGLTAFGTDGETACISQFSCAVHVRCWLHFKDNLKRKLEHDLNLPRHTAQEFISDILGNASQLERLVDADDESTFEAQLTSFQEVWDNRERQITKREPVFYTWFKEHCAKVVQDTMLRKVRRSAGLGDPPSPYYTNAVESMNSLLKLRTDHKKQDLPTFITTLHGLIESQFAEVDRAVAGVGDYEVASEYSSFHYDAAKWCTMSEKQRKKVLQQFMSLTPTAIPLCLSEDSTSADIESTSMRKETHNPLLCLSIAPYVAETIWKNASDLFQEEANFISAPGKVSLSWFVARSSSSTAKPYFVRLEKGHYQFYYQTCKVCPIL